jgi:hypothetical protein
VSAIPPLPAADHRFVAAAPAMRMSTVRLQPIGVPRAANTPWNTTMSPTIESASSTIPTMNHQMCPERTRLSVGPSPTIRGTT